MDDDLRAYRVLRHQHTPEIERVLGLAGRRRARGWSSPPHLLPARRGILATAYGRLTAAALAGRRRRPRSIAGAGGLRRGAPVRAGGAARGGRPWRAAVGTNRVVLGARADAGRGIVVVCASIDNLVKGAAGQAVQNANLMFGLPETTGLDRSGGAPAMSERDRPPAATTAWPTSATLVVAALRYIQRFSGTRAVIKYGGAAMVDPELKRSFAQDVVLLRAAGLRPVVVHGGGPEINRTLERLGQKSEFVDGQRVTGPEEMQVVEMVLTGKVNTEIVGLINTLGGAAMGLSGKDGRLLQARKQAPRPGKPDLGLVGDIEAVNPDVLDMCLDKRLHPGGLAGGRGRRRHHLQHQRRRGRRRDRGGR